MPSGINTRSLKHGTLRIRDSQAEPNTYVIPIDEGNLQITEERSGVVVMNRGELDHWSKGTASPLSISFTIKFDQYGSRSTRAVAGSAAGGAVTGYSLRDFLRNAGSALTSGTGRNDIFGCTLLFEISNPMLSGDEGEVKRFTQFQPDSFQFSEGDEYNTIQASGRALLETPVSTRGSAPDISYTTPLNLTEDALMTPEDVTNDGGTADVVYYVAAGDLPTGLALNASTGQITGTPTETENQVLTIRARNDFGDSDFEITIDVS